MTYSCLAKERKLAQSSLLVGVALVGLIQFGCATSRLEIRSSQVRDVFFVRSAPVFAGLPYRDPRQVGWATTTLDPDTDDQVFLVTAFNAPVDVRVRAVFRDPNGVERESLEYDVRSAGSFSWWYTWRALPLTKFRKVPGTWRTEIFVDGELAATDGFVVTPATSRYGLEIDDAFDALQRGEAQEALRYYEARAAQLAQGGTLSRGRAAKTYGVATYLAGMVGAYQKGIETSRRADAILERLPQIFEVLTGRVRLQLYLGQLYLWVGDFDEARRSFESAIRLAAAFTSDADRLSYLAIGHFGLSGLAFLQRNYVKSLADAEASNQLFDDFFRLVTGGPGRERNLRIFAYMLIIKGVAELELNRVAEADRSLGRALTVATDLEAKEFQAMARGALALLRYRGGDFARAQEESRLALAESKALRMSFFTTLLLSYQGNHAAERGRHGDALESYREAIQHVEDVRSQIHESSLRMLFFEDKHAIYQGAVLSALSLGDTEEAFGFAERGRARAFLDLLGTNTLLSKATSGLVSDEMRLKTRFSEAQALMQFTSSGIQQGEGAGGLEGVSRAGREARDVAVSEHETFLRRLKKENLEQAALMAVDPVTLREVQELLPAGTTLVEYLITAKETVVWVVWRDGVKAIRLPLARAALVADVRRLRNAIAAREDLDSIQAQARALHEQIFEPVRAEVRGSRLLIVPHDVLHYLPFAALMSPAGRWLIEEYTFTTLPSASVLKYLRGKGEGASDRVLAVGNAGGPNLPFAEREARMVGDHYRETTVLVRQEATETRVKELSKAAGLLHFATHAELNERDPLGSALSLAPGGKDDGRLEAREVFRLDLSARLVVLSACDTALGTLSRGDELLGLQRAFLYAGTPAVITTLWQVDDRATYELMRQFYEALKIRGPAAALRGAQLATMKAFPHPFAWAAFGLTGAPR